MENLTGILLGGGKSQRMGTDKALLTVNNQPMISYPLNTLKEWCSEILVSANDNRLNFLGYPIINDEFPGIGPMGGLYSCLSFSSNHKNIVVACDMPALNGSILKKLISVNEKCDVVVPVVNHRPEPLYALYHKSVLPTVAMLIHQKIYSLQKLLSLANVLYITPEKHETNELLNINSPVELLEYARYTNS
jgi:molybdopterin-guanine dinucleotide biosynthesis protein A